MKTDRRRQFNHRGYWITPIKDRYRHLMDVGNLLAARSSYWSIDIPGGLPLRAASKVEAIAHINARINSGYFESRELS